MTPAMKPSEVLLKAAELVEPEGAWCQGSYGRSGAPMCAAGAIWAAGRGTEAYEFMRAVVGPHVSMWNDAPNRTQSEVVAALRAAAELARGEGA